MLMRLWRFLVVVFLEKAAAVRKISHESKHHKSQNNEEKTMQKQLGGKKNEDCT